MKGLIGNTPMIKINYIYKGGYKSIYAKLEYYNLTGSIKDRIVFYIINKAIKNGKLKKGMTLVEATSGNTGIALSAIGAYFGYKVHIFMPNWVSKERKDIMELYGAKLTLVSKKEGGFKKCVELVNDYINNNNGFSPMQFENEDNIKVHYLRTGKEITDKIKVDAFISRNWYRRNINGHRKKTNRREY